MCTISGIHTGRKKRCVLLLTKRTTKTQQFSESTDQQSEELERQNATSCSEITTNAQKSSRLDPPPKTLQS